MPKLKFIRKTHPPKKSYALPAIDSCDIFIDRHPKREGDLGEIQFVDDDVLFVPLELEGFTLDELEQIVARMKEGA